MNKLIVTLPYTGDEAISNIERMLARESYEKEFWHSIVPPHKVVYVFDYLSDQGIERWKEKFRETVKNHIEPQWLSYCSFTVEEVDDKE